MDFCGLLTFSKELLFRKEVLGEIFETTISETNVKVCFPYYPKHITSANDYMNKDLSLEPPNCCVLTRNGKPIYFGALMGYPACVSRIKSVMILIDCDEKYVEKIAEKLYGSIKKWGRKFVEYCDLCTKDSSPIARCTDTDACDLSLVYEKYIPSSEIIHIDVDFIKDEDCLTKKQVISAFKFVSSNAELLFEYRMLLSAYKARTERQYRQAVVDACSAVEICLNKQIEKYCKSIGLNSDVLFEKYKSLGDKFKLIKKIDKTFNVKDPFNRIVNPRNGVVHRNEFPDAKKTWELFIAVEECLKFYNKDFYEITE